MTPEEQTLQNIRNTIAAMPTEDQARVASLAATIRMVVEDGGDHGALAISLVDAEQIAKAASV